MAVAYERTVLLRHLKCGQCGIAFAADEDFMAEKERDGQGWHCPNGHSRVYMEPLAEKYKRLYEAQQLETNRQRENYFAEQRKHELTQKDLKRVKRRTSNGVCQCCNRTFVNLQRHMKTKHPEVIAETKP